MAIVPRNSFTGINNIAQPERLPEGHVVDAVNFDFTVGGKAELRTGYTQIVAGDNIKCLYAAGNTLYFVDGNELKSMRGGAVEALRTLSGAGAAATEHNSLLYLNTDRESVVCDPMSGNTYSWAVHVVDTTLHAVGGSLPAGRYAVAVTQVINGRESGALAHRILLGEGQGLRIAIDGYREGVEYHLYCSPCNGSTLYHQGRAAAVNTIARRPADDSHKMVTENLEPLPYCNLLTSYAGMIVGARGRHLYHTEPMQTHLYDPEKNYYQFPTDITLIAPVGDGIYVCADKTYFLGGLGGESYQRTIFNFGAIPGTHVKLPSGQAAWFTDKGQVLAGPEGQAIIVNEGVYTPDTAAQGAAGLLEHNGNQIITTTMRGDQRQSRLQATDHWEIEVL